jgi:hypothetical protein
MRESDMSNQIEILKRNLNIQEYDWLRNHLETQLLKFQEIIHEKKVFNYEKLESIIPNLIGIGEGSTPQSDDIFIGIISTILCKEPDIAVKLTRLATFSFEKLTSRKSSSLIRSFLRNNIPDELTEFLELLSLKYLTPSQLLKYNTELQRIKLIGASSGLHFLYGVLWQLEYYENQKQKFEVRGKKSVELSENK